ncbi:cbb3-type cytochrome oxidase assembly protein CcoS [bacterium]|jgi:cbb3-type cytochrome oxidase maturation protein|nr:cbb3-type cytochrome oxidase assembly protein CcoS [bacterium]
MSVLYVSIPVALLMAAAAVVAFLWSVRAGQFEDLESARYRVLFDDRPARTPPPSTSSVEANRVPENPPR